MNILRLNSLLPAILFVGLSTGAQAVSWTSSATGGAITATVTEPNPVVTTPALVVYLKNLTCERIGQEPDAAILASFTATGYRVVVLDYASHVKATAPFLNADVLKIRNEIGSTTFPGSTGLNAGKNQCYILCEGYRLMRNVPYFLNDRTVYSGTETTDVELRMDIAYPSQPSRGVPIVMEYSCSNSFNGNADDRMNNGNAFTGINDTILEGAPSAGVAWAMADHPKYRAWGSPTLYSGFEVNPDTLKKVRSSVRVLREVGATLGLSGNIAIHGFSRGATAGSLAAGDLAVPAIDSAGYSTALSGRPQAVLLGSGIYDYSHSGGTTTGDTAGTQVDIYNRFVTAWGATASNLPLWQSQGAPYYMATAATTPVFLSYNTDDTTWYPYQAQVMEAKLVSLGVPYQKITGTGGHKVTTTPATLTAIYSFFKTHSKTLPNKPGKTRLGNYDTTAQLLDLTIDANGNDGTVMYAIYKDGTPRKWVQANGTVGTNPVWRTLADWGSPVRVGPLTDFATAQFTVIAYDPAKFTTAQNSENEIEPQADLAIAKTDGVTSAIPGGTVTYTITATNAGPSNVTGATVVDTLPSVISGATWTGAGAGGGTGPGSGSGNINASDINLPAGGSFTFTVTATISPAATGTLSNTATVSAPAGITDPTPGNNNATDTDTLAPQADLALTLTDSPDPVNAGGNLTYTITLTNNGPSTAVSQTVNLPVPANTTFVSAIAPAGWTSTTPAVGGIGPITFTNPILAAGETAIFTVVVRVDLAVVNNSTLTAAAVATSATTDPNPGNNSATAFTGANSGADLQITLADSPDPVVAGANLTYTLQLANNGPLDADNVSVTDALPVGTTFDSLSVPAGWTASTPVVGGTGTVTLTKPLFALNDSATFILVVKVAPGVANGTTVSDTATVTSTTIDIAPANNSATATTTVTTQADLAIQITGTPNTAPKGSNVTYAITLTNNGPSDASAPNVSLPVPSQMTFVSAAAAGGWTATTPAVGANGTVNFAAASLASGATVNFTVVAKVNANASTGSNLTAIATASASGVDPAPADNVAATIASVGTVKATAVQPVTTGFTVNPQTGLFDINVKVTNTTPLPINGFRLRVNFDAYKAAYPSLRLENATSTSKKNNVHIDYPNAVAVNATVTVKLSFYTSTRTFPSPFTPALTVDPLASSQAAPIIGGGVQTSLAKLPDKTVQLVFPTVAGRWYRVRYTSDLEHWTDCQVPVLATSNSTLWIDSGPPYTVETPANTPVRFYLVHEIEAP